MDLFGYEELVLRTMRHLARIDGEFYHESKMTPDSGVFEKELSERAPPPTILDLLKCEASGAVLASWEYSERHEHALELISKFDHVFTLNFPAACAVLAARLSTVYVPVKFQDYHFQESFYGPSFTGSEDPRRKSMMEFGSPERKKMINEFILPAYANLPWFENLEPAGILNSCSIFYNETVGPIFGASSAVYPCGAVFGMSFLPKYDTKPTRIIRSQETNAFPLEEISGSLFILGLDLFCLDSSDIRIKLIKCNKAINIINVVISNRSHIDQDSTIEMIYERAIKLFGDRAVEITVCQIPTSTDCEDGTGFKNETNYCDDHDNELVAVHAHNQGMGRHSLANSSVAQN